MSEYTTQATEIETDHRYEDLRAMVAERIATVKGPIFTTNAEGLFAAFLAGLPEAARQHYNCHCCRRFIEQVGGLVTIDQVGNVRPLCFAGPLEQLSPPQFFVEAWDDATMLVLKAKINGVFITSEAMLGTPQTGPWTHFYGQLPAAAVMKKKSTAGQVAAEKKEDFGILCRGLVEYPRDAVFQAVRVLEADVVDGSEKTLGLAKWLLTLHDAIAADPKKNNTLIWQAVASAPPGWCHVKTTMIATLLDDVVLGLDFEAIKAKWNAKMHPLRYQRPTTVKEGNLDAANKLIEKMGAERSLLRRYATLDDVRGVLLANDSIGSGWLWQPSTPIEEVKPTGKPFDRLKSEIGKGKVKPVQLPAKKIATIEEFKSLLVGAKSIEYYVDFVPRGYYALVTGVDPDSPPIIQWDGLDGFVRNPVTWFFRHGGVSGSELGLKLREWCKVTAIFEQPFAWQAADKFKHHVGGLFLALEGATWEKATRTGGGLFPAHLKASLESIKPAVERLSNASPIADPEKGDANGVQAFGGSKRATLRVKIDGEEYELPH